MKKQLHSAGGFVVFLMMCLGAQLTGSLLTLPSIRSGWYAGLEKPFFTPPGWFFGPVWTILYLTMAVAAWMIWRMESENALVKPALLLFFIQLMMTVFWPALFFSLKRPGLALLEVLALLLLISATVTIFYRIKAQAAWLLLPYLAWVMYAAIVNGAIWWINSGPASSGLIV